MQKRLANEYKALHKHVNEVDAGSEDEFITHGQCQSCRVGTVTKATIETPSRRPRNTGGSTSFLPSEGSLHHVSQPERPPFCPANSRQVPIAQRYDRLQTNHDRCMERESSTTTFCLGYAAFRSSVNWARPMKDRVTTDYLPM